MDEFILEGSLKTSAIEKLTVVLLPIIFSSPICNPHVSIITAFLLVFKIKRKWNDSAAVAGVSACFLRLLLMRFLCWNLIFDLSLENELLQLQPKQTRYILRLALTVL